MSFRRFQRIRVQYIPEREHASPPAFFPMRTVSQSSHRPALIEGHPRRTLYELTLFASALQFLLHHLSDPSGSSGSQALLHPPRVLGNHTRPCIPTPATNTPGRNLHQRIRHSGRHLLPGSDVFRSRHSRPFRQCRRRRPRRPPALPGGEQRYGTEEAPQRRWDHGRAHAWAARPEVMVITDEFDLRQMRSHGWRLDLHLSAGCASPLWTTLRVRDALCTKFERRHSSRMFCSGKPRLSLPVVGIFAFRSGELELEELPLSLKLQLFHSSSPGPLTSGAP
ncbi:uncharacterized protein B0H18DRAFT_1013819 [Fomitopsis serialis]|uniref:uncharacterized protein n=1 Tax=Fomitopsis serialis TaxID=139415 RepID=UPI00200798BB|nr:uncharacterized protein B0H18DRAFT_1013819 [Neoantrodia serialis]KAH9923867.1 hypothetical protein B0H18DRAFT_1013819 [Neoantrodia serialis]